MGYNRKQAMTGTVTRTYRRSEKPIVLQRKGSKPDGASYHYTFKHWTQSVKGSEECRVALEIDYQALFEYMAQRAAAAKSNRSGWQGGIIVAKVIGRQPKGEIVEAVPFDADLYEPVPGAA